MILALLALLILLFVVLPILGMALWAFVSIVIVGLIVGGLGRLVIPGSQPIGALRTVLAGLCGSIIGGFIGQHVFAIGWLGTVLVEIGIAALTVAVMSGALRRQLSRRR